MNHHQNIRLAVATLNQTPIDWVNNISNIKAAIEQAKSEKVDLLLLPELCLCGYGCEDLFLSDWLAEKSLLKLIELVPFTSGTAVSLGLPIKHESKLYNCACLIQDGHILGFSAKQFLANDGVHYEHRWFQPWESCKKSEIEIEGIKYPFGDIVFDIFGIKTAFEICEDMWQVEDLRPAKKHFQQEVHLILNPSASPFTFGKTKRREKIIVESTKNYSCTYLYANLLGNESGRIIFDGELFIAADGKVLAQNKRFSFQNFNLISHDFELKNGHLVSTKKTIIPQPEVKETEFYKASALGLFDYLRKSKSKCFVLSLSGGADSTVCALLVRKMIDLGIDELGFDAFCETINCQEYLTSNIEYLTSFLLHCAYQSTFNSSDDTFISAKEVADEIGATFYDWTIDSVLDIYTSTIEKAINSKLTWEKDDLALQNIQARVRAPFIWYLANLKNGLLLTTSNRSEGDVGYCTMDGDTAGGLAPISGVDKDFIRQWLVWAEKELGFTSLLYVNNLKPSAELRPLEAKQTDESDLMPYSLIVQIEQLAIHEKLSPKIVFETLRNKSEYPENSLKEYVKKFYQLWQRNQWKRERLAPGFHLDEFNVDPKTWCRFPILNGGFEDEMMEF
jgi:NAD+ synthase (glutamine-hydrolysing)